jgi:1,4-dihydroxy-2-naphthoyl-CoA synthase
MRYENLENVRVENKDALLIVTIDRPKVLNALNAQTIDELGRVFRDGAMTTTCARSSSPAAARKRSSPAPTSTSSPR